MIKIDSNNYNEIHPYLESRPEVMMFYMNQANLMKGPYFYDIRDSVCYIYKNIYYAKYIFLACPPMTLECDTEKEWELMLKAGCDCIFSDQWKTGPRARSLEGRDEYIFNSDIKLVGSKWSKWRNVLKWLDDHGYIFEFTKYDTNDIFTEGHILNILVPEFEKITDEWIERKDKKASDRATYLRQLHLLKAPVVIIVLKDRETNKIFAYNISQKIGNTIFYLYEKSRENVHNYQVKAVHTKFCEYWNTAAPGVLINKGNCFKEKSVPTSKELLKPINKIKLFKYKHD